MKVDAKVIADYVKERNDVLFSFDEVRIKAFMKKHLIPVPEDPNAFWGCVYKSIANLNDVPKPVMKRAEEGLAKLGMDKSYSVPKVKIVKTGAPIRQKAESL
ncbi:MAG: hypothetical protein LUE86_08285 [Clostridiales bacterium]|nr:hypothetical protein [Clostridiales bacterium]